MKTFSYVFLILLFVFLSAFVAKEQTDTGQQAVEDLWTVQTAELITQVNKFKATISFVNQNKSSLKKTKCEFLKARNLYKKIEFFVTYYFPGSEGAINGPDALEIEETPTDIETFAPQGLQVIEGMLYGNDAVDTARLLAETNTLLKKLETVKSVCKTIGPYEYQLYDAAQLQLVRVFTLGVTNSDCRKSLKGIEEANYSLQSINEMFDAYYKNDAVKSRGLMAFKMSIKKCIAFLGIHNSKTEFDYFGFYKDNIRIANNELQELKKKNGVRNLETYKAINFNAASLFENGAFNAHFFTRLRAKAGNENIVGLGRDLFFDAILSVNDKVSCATCHIPQKAFADGLPKAKSLLTDEPLTRNTPTIINAVFQNKLFYDMRSTVLEEQAMDVINNKKEMHGMIDNVVEKLKKSARYIKQFQNAFSGTADTAITVKGIVTALAEYERTLTAMNSAFDKSIRNEKMLITEKEKNGFNIYMGKAKCGQCHFAGLFNGSLPPVYKETEWEVIGVPATTDTLHAALDNDMGRYNIHQIDEFKNAFKTTGMRNIALTSPYMHNGVYATLKEVVDFYNKGGGRGLKINLPNQTLDEKPLNLTEEEKENLELFLISLTDSTSVPFFERD